MITGDEPMPFGDELLHHIRNGKLQQIEIVSTVAGILQRIDLQREHGHRRHVLHAGQYPYAISFRHFAFLTPPWTGADQEESAHLREMVANFVFQGGSWTGTRKRLARR